MSETTAEKSWIDRFEGLRSLPAPVRAVLEEGSSIVTMPEGAEVFAPGQAADRMLLLLDGTVRVQQHSETGRDVFLYRVHAGETCVLSTACMLAFEDYSASAVAETRVRAVAIPRATFDRLVGESPEFRQFVFRAYSRRITDLFLLIDDIVFQRLDTRLAARLVELEKDGKVQATHAKLAAELGTAREVISRTLAEFQRRGWVEQSRGAVTLTGKAALERLARSGAGR